MQQNEWGYFGAVSGKKQHFEKQPLFVAVQHIFSREAQKTCVPGAWKGTEVAL